MKHTEQPLIESLLNPDIYPHDVSDLKLVETHISWVILTGPYAYKIKKPVNFGFLDFSTLEKRKHYCEEEVRLNARLAPDLYLAVIPITGTPDKPVPGGEGGAIEYAVKMREFNPDNELDKVLDRGDLTIEHMRLLAAKIADFHQHIEIAGPGTPFGTPEALLAPCIENFEQVSALENDSDISKTLTRIKQWTLDTWQALEPVFSRRKSGGFIRECHGDLHLHNMALEGDDILVFDCIEFNPNLYWIDVFSEIAFTVMDLDDRARSDLGFAFLNRYLEVTGDFSGMQVLRFYKVYRAMVRAKVDCIRIHQENSSKLSDPVMDEFRAYLSLAIRYIEHHTPHLFITHGLSGSGKSTVARVLAIRAEAIHIRSDVERKRLYGLAETEQSDSGIDSGIYSQAASDATYRHLAGTARLVLGTGFNVIIDAAFLDRDKRNQFQQLAAELKLPFHILDCTASEDVLRQRLIERNQSGMDASEADLQVLEHQLQHAERLDESELAHSIYIDTEKPLQASAILASAQLETDREN